MNNRGLNGEPLRRPIYSEADGEDDSQSRSAGRLVHVKFVGRLDGLACEVAATCDARQLRPLAAFLKGRGFDSDPLPVHFEFTPGGEPICPRHRVAMKQRTMQGDKWYSHAVADENGKKHWCKGYPGHDSQGYHLDMGDAEGQE